ncbi:MAG TPA: 30S ribosomal protein S21 [Prolixibacteraceae bacterium]|nr:30S ribosomal protein S21 [Prolixibacteraceae bacterium]
MEKITHKTIFIMIVVPVKEGENVERALKRFKRKFEKTGVIKDLRNRQAYTKPSVERRAEIQKAIYIEQLQREED